MRRLWPMVLILVACRSAPPPHVRVDPVAPLGPTAEERVACGVIAKAHADAIARLRADSGVAPLLDRLPKLLGRCLPTTRGAYGFVLDELCIEHTKFDDGHPDADVLGRFRFLHVDGAGAIVRLPIGSGGIGACGGRIDHLDPMTIVGTRDAPEKWLAAQEPLLFDFDGDGEKEVLVDLTTRVVQDAPESDYLSLYETSAVRLLTFRGGEIVPLPSTTSLILDGSSRDLDGDGRPDLRVHRPLSDAYDQPWTEVPIEFFAHSLPGGSFAVDDEVALGPARASCSKPSSLIARGADRKLDANRTVGNVVCARLLGSSIEALATKLAAECAKDPACTSLADACVRAAATLRRPPS